MLQLSAFSLKARVPGRVAGWAEMQACSRAFTRGAAACCASRLSGHGRAASGLAHEPPLATEQTAPFSTVAFCLAEKCGDEL